MVPALLKRGSIQRWLFALTTVLGVGLVLSLRATEIGATRLGSGAVQPCLTAGGNSYAPLFSGNGRQVVFLSEANNLVTNDDRSLYLDIFVHDLDVRTSTLVGPSRLSVPGNGHALQPSISSNGQTLAFVLSPDNLLWPYATNASEVYVQDVASGTLLLARTNDSGATAGPLGSSSPLLSADGRFLVFIATQARTAPSFVYNIVRRDLQSGAFTLVSGDSPATNTSVIPELLSISADASKVAFLVRPASLPNSVTNTDIFVRDLDAQTTTLASAGVSNFFPGSTYSCYDAVLSESGRDLVFGAIPSGASHHPLFYYHLQSETLVRLTDVFSGSAWPSLSSDGRYVAYSDGTNVFVWDANTGSNTLVSLNLSGAGPGEGHSYSPVLNADASKVVFLSDATDLTAEDNHGQVQVFFRDLLGGSTSLVSVGLDGTGIRSADLAGIVPAISPDGTMVAFETADAQVVVDDNNHASDVFVRHLAIGVTELISERTSSLPSLTGSGDSTVAPKCLSADGRFLLFKNRDGGLVTGETNLAPELFLGDLVAGSNRVVSATPSELGGTNITVSVWEMSSNSQFAAFSQRFWFAGAPGPQEEVFRRDLSSGSLELASVTTNGSGSGSATAPVASADGRWLAFQSPVAGLVTNVYGPGTNIFLRDMTAGHTLLVSISASGAAASGDSWAPRISADGRWVAFLSVNRSLVSPAPDPFGNLVYARDVLSNRTYWVNMDPVFHQSYGTVWELTMSADSRSLLYRLSPPSSAFYQCYLYDLLAHSNLLVCTDCRLPAISSNNRWLAYEQPGSPSAIHQIVSKDLLTGLTNTASLDSSGQVGNASSFAPLVTPDGRYIVFLSKATNLTTFPGNDLPKLYVRDLLHRKTLLMAPNFAGTAPGNGTIGPPTLAADGQTVIFHSFASDLVSRDFNQDRDVFLLRLSRGDSDGDGMDDDWEVAYFGDLSRDGTGDYDHDGQSDLAEFLAGTDPTNGESILRVMTLESPGTSTTRLSWSAIPGKVYQAQYKTNLNNGAWFSLTSPLTATNSTAFATDNQAGSNTRRFYRVMLVQ